jgi:hypothetical protein
MEIVQNLIDLLNPAIEVVKKGIDDLVANTQEILANNKLSIN